MQQYCKQETSLFLEDDLPNSVSSYETNPHSLANVLTCNKGSIGKMSSTDIKSAPVIEKKINSTKQTFMMHSDLGLLYF